MYEIWDPEYLSFFLSFCLTGNLNLVGWAVRVVRYDRSINRFLARVLYFLDFLVFHYQCSWLCFFSQDGNMANGSIEGKGINNSRNSKWARII